MKFQDCMREGRTYIIAEMSANHGGSFERAIEIIHGAKEAGADCLKIQTFTPDTLTLPCENEYFPPAASGLWKGLRSYELYRQAFTPWEWQGDLKAECDKVGLDFLSSVFDPSSVDFLESIGTEYYKIASPELLDIPLLEYTASKGKPMIISCGIGTLEEIREAVEACRRQGNHQIYLLKCTSEYPTRFDQMNLSLIPAMKEEFGCPIGLSDHSMDHLAAVVGVSLGACIVEKHFCISREVKTPDSTFSMNFEEFKAMTEAIRNVELILGKAVFPLTPQEARKPRQGRSLFASAEIRKGEAFSPDNVKSIRPGIGLAPKYYKELLGKKAPRDIPYGTPLTMGDLDGE
ncbi:MAG: pseudaminic acid synthase [Lachnospiraceae bacterium]|nr:pseudaminic acid synthase [Lachnospiraceae bacterium]